jgi:5,10-methenyltetrahydrofolate synthetase
MTPPEPKPSVTGPDEADLAPVDTPCASEEAGTPAACAAVSTASKKDAPKQQTMMDAAAPGDAFEKAKAAKMALRRHLKATRAALDGPSKHEHDRRIGEQVLAWWRRTRPPLLAVYWPLSGEPDLLETYRQLAAEGAALALPVVVQRHAPLAFAAWTPGEAMDTDLTGIAVPHARRMVERPPALLVPCLGFNEHGYRLGYGGGFYDRTLGAGIRPATLGIAYACLAAEFPADVHDVPLDLIVTEETNVE